MSYAIRSDKQGHWIVNESTGTVIALMNHHTSAVWLLKALESDGHTVRYAKPAQDSAAFVSYS